MSDEDLESLTGEQLEECLDEAISQVNAAQREYDMGDDNLGRDPNRAMPQTAMSRLRDLDDALDSAKKHLEAVQIEIDKRKSLR